MLRLLYNRAAMARPRAASRPPTRVVDAPPVKATGEVVGVKDPVAVAIVVFVGMNGAVSMLPDRIMAGTELGAGT